MTGNRGIPRILVSAACSGAGKTTIAAGIIGALRKRGMAVAPFKCGPDYLDPTYLGEAAGSPCINLDGWMMGGEAVISTFEQACRGKDIAVIEGVMGLFDGSTADIAAWLASPVLLAVDARGMGKTIAAIAKGFSEFDPDLQIGGIIANFVGSRNHLELLQKAVASPPVLGGLPRDADHAFASRHLGLHRAEPGEALTENLETWGNLSETWLNLDRILQIAEKPANGRKPDEFSISQKPRAARGNSAAKCKIAVAMDDAFHFYYEYNLRKLEEAGAELVYFSPIRDQHLPQAQGLYFGGGYPEIHAEALSLNQSLLHEIRQFAESGHPVYAECGGLIYLSEEIITQEGKTFPMAGLIPGKTKMEKQLQALGHVEVETQFPTFLGPAGLRFRGHQFRYSDFRPGDNADLQCAYRLRPRRGKEIYNEGYSRKNILASYAHAHWASNPKIAENMAAACKKGAAAGKTYEPA